jgi:hypothetical protein
MQQSLNYPSFGSAALRGSRPPPNDPTSRPCHWTGWKLPNAATSLMRPGCVLTNLCAEESEFFFLIGEKWPALRRQTAITDLEVLAGL